MLKMSEWETKLEEASVWSYPSLVSYHIPSLRLSFLFCQSELYQIFHLFIKHLLDIYWRLCWIFRENDNHFPTSYA